MAVFGNGDSPGAALLSNGRNPSGEIHWWLPEAQDNIFSYLCCLVGPMELCLYCIFSTAVIYPISIFIWKYSGPVLLRLLLSGRVSALHAGGWLFKSWLRRYIDMQVVTVSKVLGLQNGLPVTISVVHI